MTALLDASTEYGITWSTAKSCCKNNSLPISNAKQRRVWLVLGRETVRELTSTNPTQAFSPSPDLHCPLASLSGLDLFLGIKRSGSCHQIHAVLHFQSTVTV